MMAIFQCFLNLKKKKRKIINKDSHHRQLLNRTMGFQTRFLLLPHESPVVSTELPLTLEYLSLKFIDQGDEKTSPSLLRNLSDGLVDAQPHSIFHYSHTQCAISEQPRWVYVRA